MSATALASRAPCSAEAMCTPRDDRTLKNPSRIGALIAQQRRLGDVQRARQAGERLDRGLDVAVLVSREPGLRDAGEFLELRTG